MRYTPPPGRPISSPPNNTMPTRGLDKFTAADREAVRADYLAGMTWEAMLAKHNTHKNALAAMVADLPRRGHRNGSTPAGSQERTLPFLPDPQSTPRIEGEFRQKRGARTLKLRRESDPAYRERLQENHRNGRLAMKRRGRRKAAALAAELNKTETRGVWLTIDEVTRCTPRDVNLHAFRTKIMLERRLVWANTSIYLIPTSIARPSDVPAIDDTPAPPRRWWQRVVSAITFWAAPR